MLEALLKRVDGLEKRLHDEKNSISPTSPDTPDNPPSFPTRHTTAVDVYSERAATETSSQIEPFSKPAVRANIHQSPTHNDTLSDVILDIYFVRLHGKPFHVLDETITRQRHQLNKLPSFLAMAISAVAMKYECRVNYLNIQMY